MSGKQGTFMRISRTPTRTLIWLALCTLPSLHLYAQQVELVSKAPPARVPAVGGGGDSSLPLLSRDGRFVVFASTANNLVARTNAAAFRAQFSAPIQIFLCDRTIGTTVLVSANKNGLPGNGDCFPSGVSTNGRYVLFESAASNLIPFDTNGLTDIFLRDTWSNLTTLVSIATNGTAANGASHGAVLTPDGHFAAFVSSAVNLASGKNNIMGDIFVRDLQANTSEMISVGATPTNSTSAWQSSSETPEITPDGRYVGFYSTATNLVRGVRTIGELYLRDRSAKTTTWVSTGSRAATLAAMGKTNTVSFNQAISDDGQFVAYEASPNGSTAGVVLRFNTGTGSTEIVHTNAAVSFDRYENQASLALTPDGQTVAFVANTNGTSSATTCVLAWNFPNQTMVLVSADTNGLAPPGLSCAAPALDSSGLRVAFRASGTNLLGGGIGTHLYLRDLQQAATILLDEDATGAPVGVDGTSIPQLSADGGIVAFAAPDGGLVSYDHNHAADVFVRDWLAGATELVSAHDWALPSFAGAGASYLDTPAVSADGRWVAFSSDADDLVDGDTNSCRDVFVRDRASGTGILVSVGNDGTQGNLMSYEPVISGNGRYVAFTSCATNLSGGDANKGSDVFVRDLQAGQTTLVSVNRLGTGTGNAPSFSPLISGDGRYVVFRSTATDLTSPSYAGENVFIRDLQAGTTYCITANTSGSCRMAMTPDGSCVAATVGNLSGSSSLVIWTNLQASTRSLSTYPVGVAIRPDGAMVAVATTDSTYSYIYSANTGSGTPSLIAAYGRGWSVCFTPKFSADGRRLIYGFNLPAPITAAVLLYDVQAGTTQRISPADGTQADSPDISPDGRFIAYRCRTGAGPGRVMVYDTSNATTTEVTAGMYSLAPADNRCSSPVFAPDGRTLFFQGWASGLAANDFNAVQDIFAIGICASDVPAFSAQILFGASARALTWPAVLPKRYKVQFRTSLATPWTDLAGTVNITDGQGTFIDSAPASSMGLYRVVAY